FRDLVVNPAPLPPPGSPRSPEAAGLLAKASGVIPQPAPVRPQGQGADALDLGANPPATGTSATHRALTTPSGRQPMPVNPPTPTDNGPTKRLPAPEATPTPEPIADPNAETSLYDPETPETPQAADTPEKQEPRLRKRAKDSKEPSDEEK